MLNEQVLDVGVTLALCHDLTPSPDPAVKWSSTVKIYHSNSDSSLLSYPSPFHQDGLGEECFAQSIHVFSQDRRGTVW